MAPEANLESSGMPIGEPSASRDDSVYSTPTYGSRVVSRRQN